MKLLQYTFLIIFLLSSCASFSDRVIRQNKVSLKESDLKELKGTYELFPDLEYNKNGEPHVLDSQDSKARYNLNYFVKSQESKYDAGKGYTVEIKVVGQNKIKVITKKENAAIDSVELGGKFKNGLFYLNNTYLKRNGIPYLAGGYTNYKTRIGLTKDNGLLVNYAYDNSGALLFLFWAGSDYNLGYHYKRIQ